MEIDEWEKRLRVELESLSDKVRSRPGCMLSVIPKRDEWTQFLEAVRVVWKSDLKRFLSEFPACLLILYDGLAFFEYDDATFWSKLEERLASPTLSAGKQTEINNSLSKACERFGFQINRSNGRTSYVGSAVHRVGIPLFLWDDFLDICAWSLNVDRSKLSDEEWAERIATRLGSRTRLIRFLTSFRSTADSIIEEMLEARRLLNQDQSLDIDALKGMCILRSEYFDEVPETAEFLRPSNPDSLTQHRARLFWNEEHGGLYLHLPGVAAQYLPAIWKIGDKRIRADINPFDEPIHGAAFEDMVSLKLETKEGVKDYSFPGIGHAALFDLSRSGRMVNLRKETLPIRSYVFVTPSKFEQIVSRGFEAGHQANEKFELNDGSTCFITRLWPLGRNAELDARLNGYRTKLAFRTRERIEARLFFGRSYRSGFFDRVGDKFKVEYLPIICVTVPHGFYEKPESVLKDHFRVTVDSLKAGGYWEKATTQSEDCDHFIWAWDTNPFLKFSNDAPRVLTSFGQLGDYRQRPDIRGDRLLALVATEFGIRFEYRIEKVTPNDHIARCWSQLPGSYLPWFLLSQGSEGSDWNDLILARDVIQPGSKLSAFLLRKYHRANFLKQVGRSWRLPQDEARLYFNSSGRLNLDFRGNPSTLWGLFRTMQNIFRDRSIPASDLPVVEVVDPRGSIPLLRTDWQPSVRFDIENFFNRRRIGIEANPWTL